MSFTQKNRMVRLIINAPDLVLDQTMPVGNKDAVVEAWENKGYGKYIKVIDDELEAMIAQQVKDIQSKLVRPTLLDAPNSEHHFNPNNPAAPKRRGRKPKQS